MTGWFSYDPIAADYASAAEPLYFAEPARDLVSILQLRAGERLLDIGSGSGAIAAAAMRANPRGVIVASDRSLSMLLAGRGGCPIAGELPQLPFRGHSFDAASLGFVLSHVRDLDAALREVARILVHGGRIAASSWLRSAGDSGPGALWLTVARQYVDVAQLEDAVARALPLEERLTQSAVLVDALTAASFVEVRVENRTYTSEVSTQAFLRSRAISATARFLRANVDDAGWNRFVAQVGEVLTREYGTKLIVETSASFATACTR